MSAAESPIFVKTYDFILWLLNHTDKFPKSERFKLAKRLEDAAFQVYDCFLLAARKDEKSSHLRQADLELRRLRFFLRLSQGRGLTGLKQYEFASRSLAEIGSLLGGWLKSLE